MFDEKELEPQESLLKLYEENLFVRDSLLYMHPDYDSYEMLEEVSITRELIAVNGHRVQFICSMESGCEAIQVINKDGKNIQVDRANWPKELKQPHTMGALDSYLKHAYLKVGELNDGTVKLYVEQRLLGGMLPSPGLQHRSNQYSVDNPTNSSNNIFPITPRIISDDNQDKKYQRDANNGPIDVDSHHPIIIHYSIIPAENSNLVNQTFPQTLTTVEINLFDRARNYLNDVDSAETYSNIRAFNYLNAICSYYEEESYCTLLLPPRNAILVDIFVREQGVIRDFGGVPEIHSVVLWKKADDRIVLIDPNDREFSSWLPQSLFHQLNLQIQTTPPDSQLRRIYGHNNTQYPRDCIDIAVKIAFELNDLQYKGEVSLDQILNRMMFNVSNRPQALFTVGNQYFSNPQLNQANLGRALNAYYSVPNYDRASLCSEVLLKSDIRTEFIKLIREVYHG